MYTSSRPCSVIEFITGVAEEQGRELDEVLSVLKTQTTREWLVGGFSVSDSTLDIITEALELQPETLLAVQDRRNSGFTPVPYIFID